MPNPQAGQNAMDVADAANQVQSARLNGFIPDPTFTPADYSADGRGGRYMVFGCTVAYDYDEGLLQIPVADSPTIAGYTPSQSGQQPTSDVRTPSVIVRTHAPKSDKVVRYYARRLGAWPLLPGPDYSDSNLILLRSRTIPEVPILDDSGGLYIYATTVEHHYALVRPVTAQDGFAVGAAPFANATKSQNTLPPAQFVTGLA
jgi:hypothetical protein